MARFVRALTVVGGVLVVGAATMALRAETQAPAAPATQTATRPAAAVHVTSPKEEWGHNVGDDYFLADYQQVIAYWHKLEKESNRVHIKEIGKTSEGRPQLMAIVTSPANYAKIDRYRQISAQLSHAEGLTDAQAQALAKEGKAVVWVDGGLHASEVLGAQQLIEWVYQMASRTDEETMRFLNDVIILNTFANPDGMDLISDGYMKYGTGSGGSWKLWNHYAGHDDNRDSYMNALDETTNVSKVMFREWFPQIMYNHHQTGPNGAVMFAPPFRDPFNYNFHPGIPAAMDMVGAAIATRSIEEKMPGVVNRDGQNYSTWWNGGFRTIAYFHNELGILTETIGNPTPMPNTPPLTTRFLIGNMSNWYPITPEDVWHFRRSIDYSIMANRAVIDLASKYRETFLYRIYEMGRDEIQFGKEDHWTFTPHKSARVEMATCGTSTVPTVAAQPGAQPAAGGGRGAGGGGARGRRWWWRTRRRRLSAALRRTHDEGLARSARLHHSVGPAGFRFGDPLRQRADQVRDHDRARHRVVHRRRQDVSRELARRQDRAGVPAARDGHVRAAGSPRRHPVPGRAAHAAVRQRRLDARVPDGREIRSRAR